MEAQGGNGNGGGGEVRKVHIIYFLSHKGRIEHPHLIRVHHISRNGVRLRDVKRWLSELRGKDMPESFAWSYKRRYKAGYVWQDLLDEDLITPISDNEYVLKGSEISSITFTNDLKSYGEKEISMPKTSLPFEVEDQKIPLAKEAQENLIDLSTKTSFEIEELPSFGSETSTEDTTKRQEDYKFVGRSKHADVQSQKKTEINSFLETFLNKNKNDSSKSKKGVNQKEKCSSKATDPAPNHSFGKSSSYSGSGASHMFLNFITCGVVDTNESALTVINRRRNGTKMMNVSSENENGKGKHIRHVVKGDKFGGSERLPKDQWTTSEQQKDSPKEGSKPSYKNSDSNNIKTFPAAYKIVNGPYCSQCGRQFNPEKLHSHMKSCRGMKALAKAAKSKS